MAQFVIEDAQTGRKLRIEGDSPPTEQEMEQLFAVPQDSRNFLARTFNPRRENFPEYPTSGKPEELLQAERSMGARGVGTADPNASLSQDMYGNQTMVTSRGTFYPNRPGPSLNDIPAFVDKVDEVAHQVGPYLASGAATAPTNWVRASAAQAVTGLANESLDQTDNAIQGRDTDLSRLATTPAFAAMGEAGGRALFAVFRPIFSKLFGSNAPQNIVNQNGTLTDDAVNALTEAGVTPQQVDDLALQELQKMQQAGAITKEQAERFNFFKSQGLEPTRAQVTRNADDFMMQQEAAKTSTAVRSALEGQEETIRQGFDTTIRGTGGNATTSGSPVADAVLNKASQLDAEISRLYRQVEEALPQGRDIKLNQLLANVDGRMGDDQFTNGLVSSLRGFLKEQGIERSTTGVIDATGNAANVSTTRGVNVQTAERIRQFLNSQFDSTTPYGRRLIRQLKDSLDADVLKVVGEDLYTEARAAKSAFESGLRPETLSKFDTNERSLVRNILENQIKADDVFDQAILGKSWKASDLRELKNYLVRGSQEQAQTGLQAWNDLRAETVQWIKDQTFSNAMNQAEQASMRSGAVRRAMDKIGPERLSVLFNAEERTFLNNMARLEQLRQPVPGTGVGRGPSAQAIAGLQNEVQRAASKFPMVGQLIEILQNQRQAARTLSTPIDGVADTARRVAQRRGVIPYAAPTAVVAGDRLTRENQ